MIGCAEPHIVCMHASCVSKIQLLQQNSVASAKFSASANPTNQQIDKTRSFPDQLYCLQQPAMTNRRPVPEIEYQILMDRANNAELRCARLENQRQAQTAHFKEQVACLQLQRDTLRTELSEKAEQQREGTMLVQALREKIKGLEQQLAGHPEPVQNLAAAASGNLTKEPDTLQTNEFEEQCSICDKLFSRQRLISLECCKHKFCFDCTWLGFQCPISRSNTPPALRRKIDFPQCETMETSNPAAAADDDDEELQDHERIFFGFGGGVPSTPNLGPAHTSTPAVVAPAHTPATASAAPGPAESIATTAASSAVGVVAANFTSVRNDDAPNEA